MDKKQAFVQTCNEGIIQKPVKDFLENQLNLYAVILNTTPGGIKEIFDHTKVENEIFAKIQTSIDENQIDRIVLINHMDCTEYEGVDSNTHEVQLRHAVSTVKVKFPQIETEAYLQVNNDFKKVI